MASSPPRGLSRRPVAIGAGLLAIAVIAAIAAIAVWRLGGTDEAPYADPDVSGALTLCAADGTVLTEGRLDDRPFADIVLGETALPEATEASGAVATLFAYQPREGIGASEFSGAPISAAVPFSDPDRPATQVTDGAWSVGDFVAAFPADYDGYVQLRLVLGTPELGTLTEHGYDAADLKVDGDSWRLVGGGDASCADAAEAVAGS